MYNTRIAIALLLLYIYTAKTPLGPPPGELDTRKTHYIDPHAHSAMTILLLLLLLYEWSRNNNSSNM